MKRLLWVFLFFQITSAARAVTPDVMLSDDSDLTPPGFMVRSGVPLDLVPDQRRIRPAEVGFVRLRVFLKAGDQDASIGIEGLPFSIDGAENIQTDSDGSTTASCAPGALVRGLSTLKNDRFSIKNGRDVYRISFEASCGSAVELEFRPDGNGGQALGIWRIARRSQQKLEATVGLAFWRFPIQFVWPDEQNYYGMGSVHIVRGDHWDIVGHELGHAIYQQAGIGAFGGGSHKIDECYSPQLALSEGWASYFSAWLSNDLADPDAKFEFMVPRRAPIRFENIPEDVCKGPNNEWRVLGFFWDLTDLHDDGEQSEEDFVKVWRALQGRRIGSVDASWKLLREAGVAPELLKQTWEMNFQTPTPGASSD
ncbi:MAG: hypothetical protein A2428_04940 [Bdellovibrionales bacterium RIFOXYC1_FULL_54_43]|nr:MAG: hypothetical protein A2428_04940 [Bdellovibrionales bacterium RIFOXYC1_FULL_54_43]OFZ84749.1 MAG: hypothetical protein A2603_16095 [Bdellovibrionales bacterium RIFOXYD1_FULL_55_31]